METLSNFFDWFWAFRTNDPITGWVLGNIILLTLLWKGFIKWKIYKASKTPDPQDDKDALSLQQIGKDLFRVVIPKKEEPKEQI